ncbi:MAG: AAA family ATPase [Solirubrobacteraceae bacterium]
MRARLTSGHFVGRVGELAELELALAEAAARRPVLVLLGGESGVGKTRLVGEFERRLADHDALVLRGEGVEQGDSELPYAPLIGALRPLIRERHPALQALTAASAAQLAALAPGLQDGSGPDQPRDGSGQLRLFEALLELLDLLSDKAPVVLTLEDVHWADRSTRTFVSFLARSLRQERVMLVLTYRTDELHRRHALRPLLSELERLDRARRVELRPFDRGELAEALADILGDEPSGELVERLFERSEGNPLYIEELLAAGLDGRGAAPRSLRDAFLLRIERLPDDAQRAARAIAVGRALDERTIAAVSGSDVEHLHGPLRQAVAEQVLVAGSDGRLSFRHALLREAVYDDLLPGERGELHLALARALEAQCAPDHDREAQLAATIAGHYAAAGEQPAALRATVRAALAARDVLAYGEAADLAERALELWPRVPEPAQLAALDHVELLLLAASAHGVAGDRTRAEVLLRGALRELDPAAQPRRYSALLARLARVQWSLNRGLEGIETAQQALSMLPKGDVSRERALLLAWLARTRHLRGRFRDAVREGQEALEAAVAVGDREAEAEVLDTLGMSQIALGEVDQGVARLRRSIELARDNGDLDSVATAYCNLADLLNVAGRSREALATAAEGLAAIPRRLLRSYDWMLLTISDLCFEIGDWQAARDHLASTRSQLVGTLAIFRGVRAAELALGEGDDELAGRCLDEIAPLVESSSEPQWIGAYGALLGERQRRRRELTAARATVAQALDRIELCTDDVMRIARVSAVGARVEADIAQRARDLRERAQERDAIARARIHVQRLRAAGQDGGPVERAWRTVGAAELTRARGRGDPRAWLRAADEWDALARPLQAAVARWRAAEAAVEAGDRRAAVAPARAALQSAHQLGSRWLARELTTLAERARLELRDGAIVGGGASARDGATTGDGAGDGATAPVRAGAGAGTFAGERAADGDGEAAPDPFGLTSRERQVLSLLAEGATNRQIGAALYMAEKTASVHVSRILGKLGVHSRTQAAAVAHRLHLA